jgi:hypothetical protein
MKAKLANEKGGILIIFALLLFVIIGSQRSRLIWALVHVRSELSKSVDAGALAGANNISNPHLDPTDLAEEFARANFSLGYLMTDTDTSRGAVSFDATKSDSDHTISVTGRVSSPGNLASLFGIDWITTSASGVGKNKVEIMLVLDRSGSMSGTKIANLKTAATKFVSFFQETQSEDKMGLASFATTASVDVTLGTNYVTTMTTKINAMSASGGTNTEDSLAKGGAQLPDYSGVRRSTEQQYLIFFSDGMPTALRDSFRFNNTVFDGVVVGQGSSGHANCRTSDYAYMSIANYLYRPDGNGSTYYTSGSNTVDPATTGDGKSTATTSCKNCNFWGCTSYLNTKWYLFESSRLGPVSGYSAESCNIPRSSLIPYFCQAAKTLAQQNSQALKNRYVKIYVIGLGSGTEIDQRFLPVFPVERLRVFYPSQATLSYLQRDCKEIKLRPRSVAYNSGQGFCRFPEVFL